jgi:hypothetical protein
MATFKVLAIIDPPTTLQLVLADGGVIQAFPQLGGGASIVWADDLAGSTNTNQWIAAITGPGGVPGLVPVNVATSLVLGQGADSGSGLAPIRFRNTPQVFVTVRNGSDDGDMPLFSLNGGTFYEGDPGAAWGAKQEWWAIFSVTNILNFSENTNSSPRWSVAGPNGPGTVFTVYSDDWSYAHQTSEQGEDPEQYRLGFANTGPTSGGTGPVVVQVPMPNLIASLVSLTVDLQAFEVGTADGGWWRIEQAFTVLPGATPTVTAIGAPTVTTLGTTAAAAGVNPTFTVLGDGFVSVSVTPWTLANNIGWQARQRIRVLDNGDFSFALAPAPAFGLV